MGRDAPADTDESTEYECLSCGETVTETSHPGGCPDCGSTMRNRGTPFE